MAKKKAARKTKWVCGKRKGKKVRKSSKTGQCYYVSKAGKKVRVKKVRVKRKGAKRARRAKR